jgi:hypothetical protein
MAVSQEGNEKSYNQFLNDRFLVASLLGMAQNKYFQSGLYIPGLQRSTVPEMTIRCASDVPSYISVILASRINRSTLAPLQ